MLRPFAYSAFALLALQGAATAAGLPPRPPPPVVPPFTWTGFYLGGNLGYAWGSADPSLALTDTGSGLADSGSNRFNLNGVIGGGQVGYNYQITNWVMGVETDFQGSAQQFGFGTEVGAGAVPAPPVPPVPPCPGGSPLCSAILGGPLAGSPVALNFSERLNWVGTLRGRIGWAVTPTILPYVTGGLAYGSLNVSESLSGANGGTPVFATLNSNAVRAGWVLGAGLEGVISDHWSAKIEYLHVDLGNVSGASVTPIIAPSGGLLAARYSSRFTDEIVRVGVNYRFF
jgi:outer membrane immunogenic protein